MNKKKLLLAVLLAPVFTLSAQESSSDEQIEHNRAREPFSYLIMTTIAHGGKLLFDQTKQFGYEVYQDLKNPVKIVTYLFAIISGPQGKEYDELISDFEKNINLK